MQQADTHVAAAAARGSPDFVARYSARLPEARVAHESALVRVSLLSSAATGGFLHRSCTHYRCLTHHPRLRRRRLVRRHPFWRASARCAQTTSLGRCFRPMSSRRRHRVHATSPARRLHRSRRALTRAEAPADQCSTGFAPAAEQRLHLSGPPVASAPAQPRASDRAAAGALHPLRCRGKCSVAQSTAASRAPHRRCNRERTPARIDSPA